MTRGSRQRSESEIYHVASRGVKPSAVAGLGREARDEAVRKPRAAGLSVRQVERLTGVSRGVVAKIR